MELFWGEDFAGAGVAGGLEGGEEGFVGMDFVGEAFACTLLAVVGEIGHSEVLLELVHKFEIKIKQIGCEAVNCLYRNFKLMRQSLKQGVEKESHGKRGVLAVAVGEVADIVLKMFISSRV